MKEAVDAFTNSHTLALKSNFYFVKSLRKTAIQSLSLKKKANQKNVWESLECLACVHNKLGNYKAAVENAQKAISYYKVYCEKRGCMLEERLESRLKAKLKTYQRNKQAFQPLNDSIDSANESEDEPAKKRSPSVNEPRRESSKTATNSSEALTKSDEDGESTGMADDQQNQSKINENEDEYENEIQEDKSDVTDGNETVNDSFEPIKRFIDDYKVQNNNEDDAEIEEENDEDERESDSLDMFKDNIINLNNERYKFI